ncbi:hypothetical protein PSPO01_07803 [Paraphaeosphaeria sporulosa]
MVLFHHTQSIQDTLKTIRKTSSESAAPKTGRQLRSWTPAPTAQSRRKAPSLDEALRRLHMARKGADVGYDCRWS